MMKKKYTKEQIEKMITDAVIKTIKEDEKNMRDAFKSTGKKEDEEFIAHVILKNTLLFATFKSYFWEDK